MTREAAMTSADLILFARRQLKNAHEPVTWQAVAMVLAQIIVCYLSGGKLKAEAIAEIQGEHAPVVQGNHSRAIDDEPRGS